MNNDGHNEAIQKSLSYITDELKASNRASFGMSQLSEEDKQHLATLTAALADRTDLEACGGEIEASSGECVVNHRLQDEVFDLNVKYERLAEAADAMSHAIVWSGSAGAFVTRKAAELERLDTAQRMYRMTRAALSPDLKEKR